MSSEINGWVTWLKNWFYDKDETVALQGNPTSWTSVTYQSGYTDYDSSNPLKYRKIGNLIEIRGVWKPSSSVSASTNNVVFATIPSAYAPLNRVPKLMQGAGYTKYFFTVDSSGNLTWSRAGTTSSSALSSGGWYPVQIMYMLG